MMSAMLVAPPRRTVQLAAVALLAFAVFSPALTGEFVSDDDELVRASSHGVREAATSRFWRDVAGADGLYRRAYRPVSQIALALSVEVFHADAAGLHLVNLLLHVANSLLVLRWLARRLRWRAWPEPGHALAWAALAGAALFAVHPVHTESVAWISGATDLWMTLGLLLGFEFLERPHPLARLAALGCFAGAALSKEPALLAPCLCWADAAVSGVGARERRARTLWSGLGSLAAITATLAMNSGPAGIIRAGQPRDMLAAVGFYARMLLAPTTLTFQAPPYQRVGTTLALPTWSLLAGSLVCAALIGLGLRALRRARHSQTHGMGFAGHCFADLLFILVPLAPVVILQPNVLSDRFLYAPSLGFVSLVARALGGALCAVDVRPRRLTAALSLAVLAACVVRSAQTATCFENDQSLWGSQLAAFPDHFKAIDALAESRLARGERHAARTLFERGLVQAQSVGLRGWELHSLAHLVVFEAAGRPPWDARQHNGRAHCEELLMSRRLAYSRGALHVTTQVTGRELEQWLGADPSLLLLPCARILLATGEPVRARAMARRALAAAPNDRAARELFALALARSGDFSRALAVLRIPGRTSPALSGLADRIQRAEQLLARTGTDSYRSALARSQAALVLGDTSLARAELQPALADPTDHEAVRLLAQSYVTEGRFELAEQAVANAARLSPADPFWASALESLAQARSARGPIAAR